LIGDSEKLLRQAHDIIGQVFLYAAFAIMAAVPLVILILGTYNFFRAATRRGTIVLQALTAISIWVFLTYAIVMILIVIIFSLPYPLSPSDELKSTVVFIIGCVIYSAAGAALILWTRAQARLSRPNLTT
jgi:hypothetical protein